MKEVIPLDNLTRDVLEAERLGYGCHYGNYKADHPHTRPAADALIIEPEKPEEIRICKHCGTSFVRQRNLRDFCSGVCKRAHAAQLNNEARRRVIMKYREQVCERCGRTFRPTKGVQKFCSRSCASQSRDRIQSKSCLFCGNVFKPKYNAAKFCCRACYEKSVRKIPESETA